MTDTAQMNPPLETWAIVEVMGRQRFAGRISEQVVAGASFVRVDVPATSIGKEFSKLLSAGAIYSITPVVEDVAKAIAEHDRVRPLSEYDLPAEWRQSMQRGRITGPPIEQPEYDDEDDVR